MAYTVEDVAVTMIDNGMPCVVLRSADLGITGTETPEELEADQALRERLESIRLACGPPMNLGDVAQKSIPKMAMVSALRQGGAIATRTSSRTAVTRPSACSERSALRRRACLKDRLPMSLPTAAAIASVGFPSSTLPVK